MRTGFIRNHSRVVKNESSYMVGRDGSIGGILKQDGVRGCSIDTEEALDVLEQAVHARLPEGSRNASVTLTTDNGTQFTSTRFIEH